MDTIFIISENYIETNVIENGIKEVAKKLKWKYINEEYEFGVSVGDFGSRITFGGVYKPYFEETKNNNDFINGYGCIMNINFEIDEDVLMPFLKEFLSHFPHFLIYDDTIGELDAPGVFSKNEVDNYTGNNYLYFFNNPPQSHNFS